MHRVGTQVKKLIAADLTLGSLVKITRIGRDEAQNIVPISIVAFVAFRDISDGRISAAGHDDLREMGPGTAPGSVDLEVHFRETVDGFEAFIVGNDGREEVEVELYDEDFAVKVRENMAHNAKIMLNRHLQNEGATMRRPTAPDVAELRGFDFKRWTGFREGLSAVVFDLAAATNGNI